MSTIPRCPTCGGYPTGVVENVPGISGLHEVEDETEGLMWDGLGIELEYDGTEIVKNAKGEIEFWCHPCGQPFFAAYEDEIGDG